MGRHGGYATLDNCPYTPPMGPGLWEPTPPLFTPTLLQPCWGQVRPLVLTSADECAPPPPPAYSRALTSVFYAHALAVYQTNLNLTDEQTTIAQYWADNPGATGTPPGHWMAIVGQLARTQSLSLMTAAEAYARGQVGRRGRLHQLLADQVHVQPAAPRDLHSGSH